MPRRNSRQLEDSVVSRTARMAIKLTQSVSPAGAGRRAARVVWPSG